MSIMVRSRFISVLHFYFLVLVCLMFTATSLLEASGDSVQTPQRLAYDQREFQYINEYNRMLWKYLRAVDEIKDGHYKSDLKWNTDAQGKVKSLLPYVDNSLFTGQSMLRTLNNEREILTQAAFDDNTNRLTQRFHHAVQNAQEGVDEILKFYTTPWKQKTEVQTGEVQKNGGWTKVWESMRDMVTKSREFFNLLQTMETPKMPYVESKVVSDLLPPVLHVTVAPVGAPFFGIWYKVGAQNIVVSEPYISGSPLKTGDVILGVYKFGAITVKDSSLGDAELDPTSGAEKTLIEFQSIASFAKIFNPRTALVGKTLRFLVRRDGKEMKIDVKCSSAEGGNIFQR
ncbi:MAG: hypothetical protein HY960_10280 [Ignavibacteriae bacterium]|nr:hypothetical protein [Ignavibacteriota bacterium]